MKSASAGSSSATRIRIALQRSSATGAMRAAIGRAAALAAGPLVRRRGALGTPRHETRKPVERRVRRPAGGREEVALRESAARSMQLRQLFGVLDALGDDADGELARGGRDRDQDRAVAMGVLAVERADEGSIELDHVDRELTEVSQRRVAGAEVVEGDAHAQRAQLRKAGRGADRLGQDGGLRDPETKNARPPPG